MFRKAREDFTEDRDNANAWMEQEVHADTVEQWTQAKHETKPEFKSPVTRWVYKHI